MPWPPGALPVNRTDALFQESNHPADHNAVNAAVNDTVAHVQSIDAELAEATEWRVVTLNMPANTNLGSTAAKFGLGTVPLGVRGFDRVVTISAGIYVGQNDPQTETFADFWLDASAGVGGSQIRYRQPFVAKVFAAHLSAQFFVPAGVACTITVSISPATGAFVGGSAGGTEFNYAIGSAAPAYGGLTEL